MIKEGFKILEEGCAARSSGIDIVYIYGYGFPPWKGGPMFFAENYVGFKQILEKVQVFDAQAKERHTKNPLYLPIDYLGPPSCWRHVLPRGHQGLPRPNAHRRGAEGFRKSGSQRLRLRPLFHCFGRHGAGASNEVHGRLHFLRRNYIRIWPL
ncbi:unnamed protein product [Effrenium voratum]|nr:unnamed protein product [Effrenium voratum]